MKVKNKSTNADVQKFSWDGQKGEEELIIRMMLMGSVFDVLENYDVAVLKKIFIENAHRFTKQNKSFWKLILDVSDCELARSTEKSFRKNCNVFPH